MHKNSFLLTQEPRWQIASTRLKQALPANLQSWIYEPHSLTRRLRKVYGKSVTVDLLFHRKRPALLGECRLLKLPSQRYNLIREVLLHADGKPLILARTVLPEPTIKIAKRNLSHLGTRPLGEVIFTYPKLEKWALNISCVEQNQWSTQLLEQVVMGRQIWGRRTVYAIYQHPLLVSEFFMPGALELGS